jgi:nuclear transport factor 2 (NTF2) superfamily protein
MTDPAAAPSQSIRPPVPPFTRETAAQKVRGAEDGWNSRDPAKVALAYTVDSRWRNRAEFVNGRAEITAFLTRKWAKELDYRLIKELWGPVRLHQRSPDQGVRAQVSLAPGPPSGQPSGTE